VVEPYHDDSMSDPGAPPPAHTAPVFTQANETENHTSELYQLRRMVQDLRIELDNSEREKLQYIEQNQWLMGRLQQFAPHAFNPYEDQSQALPIAPGDPDNNHDDMTSTPVMRGGSFQQDSGTNLHNNNVYLQQVDPYHHSQDGSSATYFTKPSSEDGKADGDPNVADKIVEHQDYINFEHSYQRKSDEYIDPRLLELLV
jgi:hypothetical protein